MNAGFLVNPLPEKGKFRVSGLFMGLTVGNADFTDTDVDGRFVDDFVDRMVKLSAIRHNFNDDQVAPFWEQTRRDLRRHFGVTEEVKEPGPAVVPE